MAPLLWIQWHLDLPRTSLATPVKRHGTHKKVLISASLLALPGGLAWSSRHWSTTYEWVMSHVWVSHVTHVSESCHTHQKNSFKDNGFATEAAASTRELAKRFLYNAFARLILFVGMLSKSAPPSAFMCDMTPSCVWHDSFICVTWLLHMCNMTPWYVWHDSFICVTWLIHTCEMTHSYLWHEALLSLVRHDSPVCVTWLTRMCDMTHPYVCHDSLECVSWLHDIKSIKF